MLLITGNTAAIAQIAEELPIEMVPDEENPPMKNVFYNVLWGSIGGGVVYWGWMLLDDSTPAEERYGFNYMKENVAYGATYGGIIGLALGVYLSMKGISFDANRTRIAIYPLVPPPAQRNFRSAESSKRPIGEQTLVGFQVDF